MAAGEEKILVSVRVRPLNEKEKARNDGCDWECVNNNTIICKYHNLPDKPSYTFDKVFGFECPTKQVYDDGAKEVALCVLSGINSSIFAYGQTSSGKTYTMSGITEFAMDDIFDYIEKHKQEREFTLKFSAMEIYNEAVRDLLCEDTNTPLRLLDDPERGTVVEKLKEETLTDRNHLEELLSICETQRKIGETSMNETSSRSHQILRLTIESSGREFSPESSATLAASVCFVDLAGSERASQTLSAGSRLKEGCHINRSLLTLGTVIRKLSKGKNGHIPYRDSKLTRILQNSLGGNAKTAIICTMSPARSHLEQSRNTLLFASCAKEVTTNAQVNLVVSQKALVKQLQRELARMENELKNLGPASSAASTTEFYELLKQKEELISKMEEQIQELKWQRDVAQSQIESLLKSSMEERSYASSMHNRRISYDSTDFDEPHMLNNFGKSNLYSPDEDSFLLEDTTPQFPGHDLYDKWEELAPKTTQETENAYKEVKCIEVEGQGKSGEGERVQIQDSLDDTIEKKVESLPAEREYIAVDEKAENTGIDLKREDADSPLQVLDIELHAKPESNDELRVKKLVESQDTETSMEKEDKNMSWSAQKLEARDEPTIEKLVASEETEQSVEKEDKKLSCSEQKIAAKDALTTEKLVTSEEIEKSVEKEDKNMSLSEQKVAAKDELTTEKLVTSKEIETSKEKEDKNMSWSAQKLETKDEPTIEKLVTSEKTEQSVQTEDKNMISWSAQKLEAKVELAIEKLVTSEENEQSVDEEDKNMSFPSQKVAAKDELTTEKLVKSDELSTGKLVKSQETEKLTKSPPEVQVIGDSDKDDDTYEALKKKVKEMQKTIEYFISMQLAEEKQSPSFKIDMSPGDYLKKISNKTSPRDYLKLKKSRSCRENLLFTRASSFSERFTGKTSNISFDSDDTSDTHSMKDSDYTETSNSSFHEFMAGLKKMAMHHESTHENDHTDTETKQMKPDNRDDDTVSRDKAEFERQQSQIIELWEVCNVPLVHRTYFFLLFKGDPSDFVYMEVELRRLSFLKDSQETMKRQAAKALTREKEWLAKQIPKKFGKKQREEIYKKWDVELSSKQRSMQVSSKLWINTKDLEHCQESASLVATLVGFVDSNLTPKEMFGLTFSPTLFNIKPSGWRFTNSFSRISLIGGL